MLVFPLPLAPFEHYMLADDRPDYPMTFVVRLRFSGRLDRERSTTALDRALAYHPLLRACVRGDVEGRTSALEWVNTEIPEPFLNWDDSAAPVSFPRGLPIDLHAEAGLRVWVRAGPDTAQVVLQIHHACCDGLGALHFIETWLAAYQGADLAVLFPEMMSPEVLSARGQSRLGLLRQLWRSYRSAFRIARFYKTAPQPVALPNTVPSSLQSGHSLPAFHSYCWSADETQQMLATADELNVSLNAWLLHKYFLALDDWNRSQESRERRPLRIIIPVNLRDRCQRALPAMNAVSMAFLDRDPAQIADENKLLAGLVAELDEAKSLRRGMALLPVLRLIGKISGGFQSQLRSDRCLGSAIFSNLGIPFAGSTLACAAGRLKVGDVILESVETVAPLRPLTHTAIALFTYANRLQTTLSYDPHHFTAEYGLTLLKRYLNRVQSSAGITTLSGEFLPGPSPSLAAG